MRSRLLVLALTVNAVLSLVALAGIVWVVAEPQRWFSDAYAEQGPRGERGPRGDPGPIGPSGRVGPDALEATSALEDEMVAIQDELASLQSELGALEQMTSATTLEAAVEDAQTAAEEAQRKVDAICDMFAFYDGALNDIWLSAC